MRARNIKPGFFKNEDLAECEPMARLLYVGLWCLAYKDGTIEYRPKKIKAEIFPYENGSCNVEKLLEQLTKFQFISILEHPVTNHRVIYIPKFSEHQSPHRNEKGSDISNLQEYREISGNYVKVISPLMNDERGMMKDERGKMSDETKTKKDYGEFQNVKLTLSEFEKIVSLFGEDKAKEKIETLSGYIASKGKKYKSHYATILNWARDEIKEINKKPEQKNEKTCAMCLFRGNPCKTLETSYACEKHRTADEEH